MVTLSSYLIWQIISVILPPNKYDCVYTWTTLGSRPAIDLQKMLILEKNHLFRWSSFWSCRMCKQAKLSHLGHRKPARINWKPTQIVDYGPEANENEKGEVIKVKDDRYRALLNKFLFTKIEEEILATFGFNRTKLRATQPKLHPMFCTLVLKIALSAAELMSFGHLGTAIWHRWTIICGVASTISVKPTSQR